MTLTKIRKQNLCECEVCQHKWISKIVPDTCPKCGTREWNGKKRTGRPPSIEKFLELPKPRKHTRSR